MHFADAIINAPAIKEIFEITASSKLMSMRWVYCNFTLNVKNQIQLNSSDPLSCWGS